MVQTNGIKPKIVIISGPTASGKTELSVRLAKEFDGEIIGCDSMQIYKGMNIGTGKITEAEKDGIFHSMIDIVYPYEEFSVSDYQKLALEHIDSAYKWGKLPILTGGTGFYINAVLNGLNFAEAPKSEEVRIRLKKEAESVGAEGMHLRLREIDPVSAEMIDPHDLKRTIRALEIYELTGVPKSRRVTQNAESPFNALFFVVNPDRAALYESINRRVEKMFEKGLIDEVRGLAEYRNTQAMQAIGYKEVLNYLDGRATKEETIALVQLHSRRYAKRQITYLKGIRAEKIWVEPLYEILRRHTADFVKKEK